MYSARRRQPLGRQAGRTYGMSRGSKSCRAAVAIKAALSLASVERSTGTPKHTDTLTKAPRKGRPRNSRDRGTIAQTLDE